MAKHSGAKNERVIEAVRSGLDGEAAVQFVHENGYAITPAGITRHLKSMGGRGHVEELIDQGLSNVQILHECFPRGDFAEVRRDGAFQLKGPPEPPADPDAPLYPETKLSIKIPSDLYEALRAAARVEHKTHNQLITGLLTAALSRLNGADAE